MPEGGAQLSVTEPNRKWRWWHVGLAGFGAIILLSLLFGSGGTLKLRVTTSEAGGGYKRVQAVNVGEKPIDVTDLRINDRGECGPRPLPLSDPTDPFQTVKLQIGETAGWFTVCRVVRATFTSNSGSATYEFK